MKLLGASLMVADFLHLGEQIRKLEDANIDFYHIDIMDGQFVDNFALSIDFIKVIRPLTQRPVDVHLMVNNPERYIPAIVDVGADMITVHAESVTHLQAALSTIKKNQVKSGVALNPSTPVDCLEYVAELIDVLLIMTVNPGFAGQQFIETMYDKIGYARRWLNRKNAQALIEVDGNISHNTLPRCLYAGADMYVLGTSALFKPDGDVARHLRDTRLLMESCLEER